MLDRRYRVDAPIASGGMSTVYRGIDVRLDRPVAIKVMDPKFAADPQFLERFEFEARAVAKLKHPSLVSVYDQGHDGRFAFLVMELVSGGTLRELLRERGPMPPHAARAVAEPVLDALGVAHAAGLVHRDVKPENILISDSGEVKIADFGLVRAVAAARTTSNSVILGTAAYLSPEQVSTGFADARSDVYSMGVLLYEMLTGKPPFDGDTSLSIAYQRLHADVPAPGSTIPGVPAEFDELVAGATAREPDHRFPNATAMAGELRSIAATLGLPPYRVPAPKLSAEHRSSAALARVAPVDADAPTRRTPVAPGPIPAPVPVAEAAVAAPVRQHTKVFSAPTPRDDVHYASPPGSATPPPPPPPQRTRRAPWFWLLLVLALALALAFTGWWFGSGRYVAVPPTDGLDRNGIVAALEGAGLTAEIREVFHDTAPPNMVIGTDPASGSRVPRGDTVAVLVSRGKPVVPNFNPGDPVAEVEKRLREAGFKPVDGGETFNQVPKGTVAALDPAPGTKIPVGAAVQVVRSKGAPPVQLPTLKNRSVEDAKSALSKLGINVSGTTTSFDKDVDGGKVIGTDPKSGSTVNAGSDVTLVVSNAVTMPWVLGQTASSARSQLSGLGLSVEVRGAIGAGLVIGQNPGAGDRVEPGSKVVLTSLP